MILIIINTNIDDSNNNNNDSSCNIVFIFYIFSRFENRLFGDSSKLPYRYFGYDVVTWCS